MTRPRERPPPGVPPEILEHYAIGLERGRLAAGAGALERARTEEALQRFLPPPPACVLDVGGGAGAYAIPLAARGYRVVLVDPVPLHVTQALEAAGAGRGALAGARVGDARSLEDADGTQDAVLLLGPLYHLTERTDRVRALREASRVLRPGGWLFAAAISRFASLLYGLVSGALADPAFAAIADSDLDSGQHRNPTPRPEYFTTAFFHHPDELRAEVTDAGFVFQVLLGLEGPGWLLGDFDRRWSDPAGRDQILSAARTVEAEPALAGLSAHMLAVARRPPA